MADIRVEDYVDYVNTVVGDIRGTVNDVMNNLLTRLEEAGVSTENIQTPGDLVKVLEDQGLKQVANLVAALVLAEATMVRGVGRTLGGDAFDEVLNELFEDFPGAPTAQDIDTILQEAEQSQSQQQSTSAVAERVVEKTTEEEKKEEEKEEEE
ncbi:MAG: hypothetical protein GXO43_03850 [Crenarchaeota archaeon]|nr:hypothetical protein [Thermoproteota archaeon]